MNIILQFINNYVEIIIIGLSVFVLILLVLYIISLRKFKKHKERYNSLTRGLSGANIEDLFLSINRDISSVNRDVNLLEDHIESLETKLSFALQRIGFVRYNAFGDMGSELSFSIALLDSYNNGFVLTSIYGRERSVSFSKPIKNGKTNIPISPEEMLAIDRALKGENTINPK